MPRPRAARVLGMAVAVVVLIGLWFVAPVVWVEIDEGGVPSRPNAKTVPAGVDVAEEKTECGSGGCWRELTVSWPGHSRRELWAALGNPAGPENEVCRPASWLDRRVVCLNVPADRQPVRDDAALIHVRWQRPLGL